MSSVPFFIAACPACLMKKQVELHSLGQHTRCHGCGKRYCAEGPDSSSAALEDPVHYWINFTDHSILPEEPFPNDAPDIGRRPR